MKIKSIRRVEKVPVYDIEVEEAHHYILENGVLTHNSGLKYAASTIVMITKTKDKEGTDVIGNILKVTSHKSRYSKENQKVELKLNYETGLDKYYGLLDLAEKYDIIKKVSTRYEMPDGSKFFASAIYRDPEKFFTKDILDKLDEAAKKEYSLGMGSENIENELIEETE